MGGGPNFNDININDIFGDIFGDVLELDLNPEDKEGAQIFNII